MKSESNRPITLEDLLRLKRAERPPAEFWAEFDRSLRAKQLAALVEKRPWWQTLPRLIPTFSRYRLPIGASAVLALSLVTFRHYHSAPAAQPAVEENTAIAQADSSARGLERATLEPLPEANVTSVAMAHPEIPLEAPAPIVADAPVPGDISRVISLGGTTRVETMAPSSPSSGTIAANLAAVQAAEPVATRGLFASANGFESRAMPARAAIDPLQQMTPPGETRRSRLQTAMVSMTAFDTSTHATERTASRISEERLYDQISRFGARGDRFQVKF